jgi:ATP/maltotriose-dependent transcriptional regulator MalT
MILHTASSIAPIPKVRTSKQNQQIELLTTKLSIPASRPRVILRDGLIAKLNNGLSRGCQLTLVAAPAGAGKTTLLSSWLSQLAALCTANQDTQSLIVPLGLAWLTLDREDNQPIRFWWYLIGALQTINANLGREAQRLLMASQRPPIRNILSLLLNDLAAYSDQIILVLDNFEAITASAIHKGLVFIADHAPAQLHMVLSSRSDPPLPVARFRAHDQLAEVRGKELDFTLDESAAFLSSLTGVPWRAQDAWALHTRTEGWVAGLQIAGLELQKLLTESSLAHVEYEIAQFIGGFSGNHQDIREFLEEEVIQRQPPHIQAFLLLTSTLEWLNASLCDAVTGQTGSQGLLEHIVRANLFIVPVEGASRWYRYHHMFAEVLRARLCRTQPDLVPMLHRRAAAWYQEHGDAAVPMFAGFEVIVVDPPTDDVVRLGRESSRHGQASERAMLPALSPLVQERVVGEEASVIYSVLDRGDEIVQLVEQLTQRELQVLRLLAEGLSYLEISHRLVIGLNTVRFHVKNIYGKLAVHQRTQAIARARALRLLLS